MLNYYSVNIQKVYLSEAAMEVVWNSSPD